jgi:hypothetical protein
MAAFHLGEQPRHEIHQIYFDTAVHKTVKELCGQHLESLQQLQQALE